MFFSSNSQLRSGTSVCSANPFLHRSREDREMSDKIGVLIRTGSGPGVLHQLTGVIARHEGDIASVEISAQRDGDVSVYFEIAFPNDP